MGMGVGPETPEEVETGGLDMVPEGASSGDWASSVPWKLGVLLLSPPRVGDCPLNPLWEKTRYPAS